MLFLFLFLPRLLFSFILLYVIFFHSQLLPVGFLLSLLFYFFNFLFLLFFIYFLFFSRGPPPLSHFPSPHHPPPSTPLSSPPPIHLPPPSLPRFSSLLCLSTFLTLASLKLRLEKKTGKWRKCSLTLVYQSKKRNIHQIIGNIQRKKLKTIKEKGK